MKNAGKCLEDIKNGYVVDELGNFHCNFCDASFEDGEIFPVDGHFYRARKAVQLHIKKEHGSVFTQLSQLDKKSSTLTDVQKILLQYMYEGKSDKEIASLTNTSPSTVRHQRFVFKEKAKQVRMFLALYELSVETRLDDLIDIHEDACGVDERFVATLEEQQQVFDTMFISLIPLRLKQIPAREKKKIMVLRRICEELEPHRIYDEKEINAFLKDIHDDYATLRRYLVEYGFLHRTKDCTKYSLDASLI